MLQDNDNQTGTEQLVMAVIVTKTGASSDSPKDIGIVIEGRKLLQACLLCSPWFDVCTDSPLSQASKVYLCGQNY